MNLLASVELHQCGQTEVIITIIITEDAAFFLGEQLIYYLLPTQPIHAWHFIVISSLIIKLFVLGAEIKHRVTLIVVRVREEATGILYYSVMFVR